MTTLARLGGDPDGYHPQAALIDGDDGFLYGTTEAGGPANLGTIFKVAADGTGFTTIDLFTGGSDGANPTAALVAGGDGNFYGTTPASYSEGGSAPGTVFRVTPAGVLTTLASFDDSDTASAFGPTTALVEGTDGNFYGVTKSGGTGPDTASVGTFYRVTPGGVPTTLHPFNGTGDGSYPETTLALGPDGNFYGSTLYNTLFQATPAGAVTTIHTYASGNEGVNATALVREPWTAATIWAFPPWPRSRLSIAIKAGFRLQAVGVLQNGRSSCPSENPGF